MKQNQTIRRLTAGLNLFIGVGALIPGILLTIFPYSKPWGINPENFAFYPFETLLVPGLFFLFILGIGNALIGTLGIKKHTTFAFWNILMGMIQMAFIVIQVICIKGFSPLHFIFFLFGVILMIYGLKYYQAYPFKPKQN